MDRRTAITGQQIGHYKILEKLGEGGMGVVYKAHDTKLDRTVALKFLPHHLIQEERERARFLQEAKAAAALNHPNVCTIIDILESNGQQFIVMEYVDGVTLKEKTQKGGLVDLAAAISYGVQIAEALEEAHSKGIVHRDIKSENIMVNSRNQIKVMDFGLAKLKGSLKLTRTSSTVGTLAYMAPEQIQGGAVDARSDVFSFGIVLYEMLSGGQTPFRGEHEAAMMYSILNEDPEPISKYRPDIPSELLHILNRALEKDPEERYQTVRDMLIDLRRLQRRSTRVLRTSTSPAPPADQVDAAHPTGRVPSTGPSPSRKYIIGGAAIMLIAALLIVKLFFGRTGTVPFQSIALARIATTGRTISAVISPDGKYVAYSVDNEGKQSVWLRQVNAASSVQIVPSADVAYAGLTFSPDGEFLYFIRRGGPSSEGSLYRMSSLGGTPHFVVDRAYGSVGISPDGKRLAFVRSYPVEGEDALMVCDADGSNLRKLMSRKGEEFLIGGGGQGPAWSPDGTMIACAVGTIVGGFSMSIITVSASNGLGALVTDHKWFYVGRIGWAGNGNGLIAVAQELTSGTTMHLWYVPINGGPVRRLTTDLASYEPSSLSVTADQSKFLALQISLSTAIVVLPGVDSHKGRECGAPNSYLEGHDGLDWTPNGRLVFTSIVGGNTDIWSMNADGSDRLQLTSNPYKEWLPDVSRDGRFITYLSLRDSTPHVWRMDVDGNNQLPLTSGMDDYEPHFAPDGNWVYFASYRDQGKQKIWKVPAGGGNDPVKVSEIVAGLRDVSPDGKQLFVRFFDTTMNGWRGGVLAVADGRIVHRFDFPLTAIDAGYRCMPDGTGVAYIDTRRGVSNVWVIPLSTMKPYQLTHYTSDLIFNMAWSKDGKDLALVRGQRSSEVVLMSEIK